MASSSAPAQELIEGISGTFAFAGPALALPCVAVLERDGPDGLVELYRTAAPPVRGSCLDDLLRSLSLEPEFTTEDFRRLVLRSPGSNYYLSGLPGAADLGNRIAVNRAVAEGLGALVSSGIIRTSAALPPLVACLEHPLADVASRCNRALMALTRHRYGAELFGRSAGAPAFTADNLSRVVAEWREYLRQVAVPVWGGVLETECAAVRAEIVRAVVALIRDARARMGPSAPRSYDVALSYLGGNESAAGAKAAAAPRPEAGMFRPEQALDRGPYEANWPQDGGISRVALDIYRPGLSRPVLGQELIGAMRLEPDYVEIFPAIDVAVRFQFSAGDVVLKTAVIDAVREVLNRLRALDAAARPTRSILN